MFCCVLQVPSQCYFVNYDISSMKFFIPDIDHGEFCVSRIKLNSSSFIREQFCNPKFILGLKSLIVTDCSSQWNRMANISGWKN